MYIEHIVYNLAFAVVAVMLLKPRDAGWCTLIFVISGCIPDIDGIFDIIHNPPTFTNGIIPHMVEHSRQFHNMEALLVFAVIAGIVLVRWQGLKFSECVFFAGAGFAAHLFEDMLVYNQASAIFWPFSSQEVGFGLLPHTRDFLGVANTEVLAIGMVLLALAVTSSMILKRTEWAEFPWVDGNQKKIPSLDEYLHVPLAMPVPDDTDTCETLQKR
ncbi:MAG: metal-dependent hydrolase [Methanoregula sp.]|nr:metal-dependent hydrolase [Methanoregula sp.]